jgi:hypothetical protein
LVIGFSPSIFPSTFPLSSGFLSSLPFLPFFFFLPLFVSPFFSSSGFSFIS